jgi:hypothetical protein
MASEFLGRMLNAVIGKNWRTSASAIVVVAAGFVAANPDDFHGWPLKVAQYAMLGGFAAFGINAKDKQVTGVD